MSVSKKLTFSEEIFDMLDQLSGTNSYSQTVAMLVVEGKRTGFAPNRRKIKSNYEPDPDGKTGFEQE